MNTTDVFNTLRARHIYNEILKFAVDILMQHDIDLRVIHVAGEHNQLADFLSRRQLQDAQRIRPFLQLPPYQPPHELVEAVSQ